MNNLKKILAQMIPDKIIFENGRLVWLANSGHRGMYVKDTELDRLCWLAEERLNGQEQAIYSKEIGGHATWSQRVEMMALVKW